MGREFMVLREWGPELRALVASVPGSNLQIGSRGVSGAVASMFECLTHIRI